MIEKEVKYCAACQESFVRKFGFCPNCGAKLSSSDAAPVSTPPVAADNSRKISPETDYRVTFVAAKNVKQRNLLLLGAVLLLTTLGAFGVIYSIFNKTLDLAAVETEDSFLFISAIDPAALEPPEELKKDKKKTGGGSGGREDENPTQKGADATQVDNPLFAPSKDYVRLTDPDLKIRAATKGTKQTPVTDEPYGLKTGGLNPSDGQGCCAGQGERRGRGQGLDGDGDGLGPGKDGGDGGDGIGPNGGNPRKDDEIESLKVRTGVTQAIKILSKPRAIYTDLARQNVVQGKVVLRVTFLASGAIGAIAVVSGLPNGLTEQAIAAARSIKFEPAKVNGTAVATTKTIEYSFTIF